MHTNLAEVCLMELGLGGNYVRCLVIVVISMGLGGAKTLGGGFRSSFWEEQGK